MTQLSFDVSKNILSRFKLPYCKTILVTKRKEIEKALPTFRYPMVMKISSSDIIHKSDQGYVQTGILSSQEALHHYDTMMRNAKQKKYRVEGILLQEQQDGIELIVGGKRDPQFGPVIAVGLGGIFVEIIHDVQLGLCPLTPLEAEHLISSTKAYTLLQGYRGSPKANMKALISLLITTSRLISHRKDIVELDFNPVMVNSKSASIVDARIMVRSR